MTPEMLKAWGLDGRSDEEVVHALAAMVEEAKRTKGGQLLLTLILNARDAAVNLVYTVDLHDERRLLEAVVRARAMNELAATVDRMVQDREDLMKERSEAEARRKAAEARREAGEADPAAAEGLGIEVMGMETRTQTEGGEVL